MKNIEAAGKKRKIERTKKIRTLGNEEEVNRLIFRAVGFVELKRLPHCLIARVKHCSGRDAVTS